MALPLVGVDVRALLVDSAGAPLAVGGGTQYQDGATQANPIGNVVEWLDTSDVVRAVSATKPLPVNIISGGGGTQTDASAWTTAVTGFVPGGGVFNDSAADLVSGTQGTLRLTAKRAQHANLRTAAGVEIGIAAAPLVAGGALTNNSAAPGATNIGALTAIANAAAPSYSEGNLTGLSMTLGGLLRTVASGSLTNNSGAPGATNVGALTAIANAAVPSYTEGRLVALSMDLGGLLRVDTEITAPALNGDAFDTAATSLGMVGTVMHGLTQGATTASRIKAHDTSTEAKVKTINGLVVQAYNWVYNGATWDYLRTSGSAGALIVGGDVAHDGVDLGNPVKLGMRAIAHGTNPTSVAAADRTDWLANRAGIPFVMGGHPNIQTIRATYTTAQTDTAVITVATGTKIIVTGFMVTVSNATTVNVSVLLGFGTANTPTTSQVIGAHLGIAPGSGFGRGGGSGIIGIGADDEDLRITCGAATNGAVDCCVSYYTVTT